MNNFSYERLHSNLQYLKLNTIEEVLDNYLEIAARDSKTTMEVLDYLFEQEKKHREAAAIERRMKSAAFPVKKTLDEFDFEFQSSIDKKGDFLLFSGFSFSLYIVQNNKILIILIYFFYLWEKETLQ
ncbi:predicted protein [Methanosarcina acetivorans C2A]|uniref:IstB-like ATP-binding domain-containing protein n=1 Tax=Methanosarcina acetivorans (strain ATCC 35395 / DSM 2834 / JCM 12185 / C2A) TaxID=188937 RepID=Q8TMS4_METAC|nr:predicted protein [Methanosarcina acetivorans C2A]